LDFGERAAVQVDVLTETAPSRADHGGEGVDDELGAPKVGRRLGESHGGELEQDEDVVAEHRLHGCLAEVVDLLGFVDVGGVSHCIKLTERPRARA